MLSEFEENRRVLELCHILKAGNDISQKLTLYQVLEADMKAKSLLRPY